SDLFNFSTDATTNADIAFFTDDLYLDKATGYIGIGTTAPASALDIKGGAVATEGVDLVTNGTFGSDANWDKGTGWTIAGGVATKVAGTASNLSQDLGEAASKMYHITFDYTRTAGTLTVSIGGVTHSTSFASDTGAGNIYVYSSGTGDLTFIADATFAGTVDNVVVKEISASLANTTNRDSAGSIQNELRVGGTGNLFLGVESGKFNVSGTNNNAMGNQALYSNTTGNSNNAMGNQALYSNTTGGGNNAIGYQTLYANTTGIYNNAIGYQTLSANTTGGFNTAIGLWNLRYNTTGAFNTAIGGWAALMNNTTGSNNYAVGYAALSHNTIGSDNVGLGPGALYYNYTGSNNIAIGSTAGFGASGGSSISNSVLVGYGAGRTLLTGGDNNILLGYQAGDNLTTGAKNIVIGYNIDAPTATSANTLNIGNLIFGTGLTGSGATSAGSVGIGTTTPSYKLDINQGTVNALNIATLDQDNQKGINLTVSANTNGDDVYGIYTSVNAGTGGADSNRYAYAMYNVLRNPANYGAGGNRPYVYGIYNDVDFPSSITTSQGNMWGTYNNVKMDNAAGNRNFYGLEVNAESYTSPSSSNDNITGLYTHGTISASGTIYHGLVGLDASITNAMQINGGGEYVGGINAHMNTANDAYNQKIYGYRSWFKTYSGDTGYGVSVEDDNSSAGGTQYGVYINLDDTDVTRYGIYETGGANNYFKGNVGIGDTSSEAMLDVMATQTSGILEQISYEGAATLAGSLTGLDLDLSTNVTPSTYNITGLNLELPSGASGDMTFLKLVEGSSTLYDFDVTTAQFNVPTSFNSAGDAAFSYDLIMANPGTAYIKFQGAGYIETESPYGNYDLTLLAANAGAVFVSDVFKVSDSTASTMTLLNQTGSGPILDIQKSGTSRLYIKNDGNVGIGTAAPVTKLDVRGIISTQFEVINSTIQINSLADALKYFDVWLGSYSSFTYAGTEVKLPGVAGYAVGGALQLGKNMAILPIGWSGTVTAQAKGGSNWATTVYLQTSINGTDWTTQSQTTGVANTGWQTLTYTVASIATPLYVRFYLTDGSGTAGVGNYCKLASVSVTNLPITPSENPLTGVITTNYGNVGIGTAVPGAKLDVSGNAKFYSAIGAGDDVRTGLAHYDSTAQAAGVGGQIVLGYKYTDAGAYTEGAIIKMYKENGTTAEYGSGLKFQVRNTGAALSTKMVLNPSGNVGIGTAGPTSLLQIWETSGSKPGGVVAATKSVLKLSRNGTTNYSYNEHAEFRIGHGGPGTTGSNLDLYINGAGNTTDIPDQQAMTWNYAGNVGIGDATPDYLLDVAGTAGFDSTLTMTGSAANIALGSNYLSGDGGDEGIYVDSGGKVGIGTPSPSNYLHVYSTGTTVITSQTTGAADTVAFQLIGGAANANWYIMTNRSDLFGAADSIGFYKNSGTPGTKLVIQDNGNVGIGTAAPGAYKLHVEGGMIAQAYTTGDIMFRANDNGPDIWRMFEDETSLYTQSLTTGQTVLTIKDTGNIGIGTTNPGTKFAVKSLETSASAANMFIDTTTGSVYRSTSSLRYKDDVQTLQDDFTKILEARPTSFIDKATGRRDVGFIAEEFDALGLSNLVIYDEQGRPDAIKYERISLYQNEVLKEQQQKLSVMDSDLQLVKNDLGLGASDSTSRLTGLELGIGNQESGILSLESRINNQESRIQDLETRITNYESRITENDADTAPAQIVEGASSEQVDLASLQSTLQTLVDSLSNLENVSNQLNTLSASILTVMESNQANTARIQELEEETQNLQQIVKIVEDKVIIGDPNKYLVLDAATGLEINSENFAVDKDGNVKVKGELKLVSGRILSETGILELNPGEANDTVPEPKVVVKGKEMIVEGDLKVGGKIIAGASDTQAAENKNIITSKGVIKAGEKEAIIETEAVSEDSFIGVTPLSAASLYVSEIRSEADSETSKQGFTVSALEPAKEDIQFNWWVIIDKTQYDE
ncbi:MAG: hypothetical protein PHW01_04225, partial [Patescibacteria group bacterium]|nr:hypothetical protein [Patescibacteria group bacterium]